MCLFNKSRVHIFRYIWLLDNKQLTHLHIVSQRKIAKKNFSINNTNSTVCIMPLAEHHIPVFDIPVVY